LGSELQRVNGQNLKFKFITALLSQDSEGMTGLDMFEEILSSAEKKTCKVEINQFPRLLKFYIEVSVAITAEQLGKCFPDLIKAPEDQEALKAILLKFVFFEANSELEKEQVLENIEYLLKNPQQNHNLIELYEFMSRALHIVMSIHKKDQAAILKSFEDCVKNGSLFNYSRFDSKKNMNNLYSTIILNYNML
jgi:hypothetical protein